MREGSSCSLLFAAACNLSSGPAEGGREGRRPSCLFVAENWDFPLRKKAPVAGDRSHGPQGGKASWGTRMRRGWQRTAARSQQKLIGIFDREGAAEPVPFRRGRQKRGTSSHAETKEVLHFCHSVPEMASEAGITMRRISRRDQTREGAGPCCFSRPEMRLIHLCAGRSIQIITSTDAVTRSA